MFKIGLNEILIISVVILIVFSGKIFPTIMRAIANAIREFKSASKGKEESKE